MTHDRRHCCNHDCCQGRACPSRREEPWWAEIIIVMSYVVAAIFMVAMVIYAGSKFAGYLLTISPIIK